MADERAWYVNVRGEKRGPISSDELKRLAARGDIDRTSLVWCDGLADWAQAGTVKGLFAGPPPVREPIKLYEIAIDQEALRRRMRDFRGMILTATVFIGVGIPVGILTKGLYNLLGLVLIILAILAFFMHLKVRGYATMKYCVINDSLQVSCNGFSRSIPIHSITDVQVVQVNGVKSLVVQAGVLRTVLEYVLDPDAAANVLLSGRR